MSSGRRSKLLIDEKKKQVRLTEKETNILKYLYRAGAKPVAREELLTEVWGYNAGVTTHTLETHIYRLRQKIEPEAGVARLLLTRRAATACALGRVSGYCSTSTSSSIRA